MEYVKTCMLAVIVILFVLPLRQEKPQFGIVIGTALGLSILLIILQKIKILLSVFDVLKNYVGVGGGYLGILIKVLGITYVCEFAADICRDSGYGFVAGQLEILGKLSVMVSGVSLLFALVEQIGNLA